MILIQNDTLKMKIQQEILPYSYRATKLKMTEFSHGKINSEFPIQSKQKLLRMNKHNLKQTDIKTNS